MELSLNEFLEKRDDFSLGIIPQYISNIAADDWSTFVTNNVADVAYISRNMKTVGDFFVSGVGVLFTNKNDFENVMKELIWLK